MKLVLNGISFHTCPVQTREKITLTDRQRSLALKKMHAEPAISEAAVLQTCNRTEFYTCAKKDFDVAGFLARLIAELQPRTRTLWQKYSKQAVGLDAVRHLLKVAAGLDSQILGENQILAQVKNAYTESSTHYMSKFIFHKLFHTAFRTGKTVRTKTNISCGAVSISLAAVELAKSELDLPDSSAMVIGAGENARLAAHYLKKNQPAHLYIANRSKPKAAQLAKKLNARPLSLNHLTEELADVDLIITSTASSEPVLTFDLARETLSRRKKSLLIIDIAVPRDIDPAINRFKCVSLYNIDSLNDRIDKNKKKRLRQIPKAEKIVDEFTKKFADWYDSLDLVPIITKLTKQGIRLAHIEAARYAKDFSDRDKDKLKLFAESLVKKILHGPISCLKDGDGRPDTGQIETAELISKIFFSKQKPE